VTLTFDFLRPWKWNWYASRI